MKDRLNITNRLRKNLGTVSPLHFLVFSLLRSVQMGVSALRSSMYRHLYDYGHGFRISRGASIAHPKNCRIGKGCYLEAGSRIYSELYDAQIQVGSNCRFGRNSVVDFTGGLEIGNNVVFSEGVLCFSHSHGFDPNSLPVPMCKQIAGDVWIGAGAIITERARQIGRGAVVAAGSVVTRNVAEDVVVAGNPARPIRRR